MSDNMDEPNGAYEVEIILPQQMALEKTPEIKGIVGFDKPLSPAQRDIIERESLVEFIRAEIHRLQQLEEDLIQQLITIRLKR